MAMVSGALTLAGRSDFPGNDISLRRIVERDEIVDGKLGSLSAERASILMETDSKSGRRRLVFNQDHLASGTPRGTP